MNPELILGALILAPVILLMALRVNATLVFLSLCLGSVLSQFVAGDAVNMLGGFTADGSEQVATSTNMQLILLLLPVVLTTLFMIRTVHGNFRLALNALPAIGVGLLGALLIVPLLPPGTGYNIFTSGLWMHVQNAQNLIVGTSAVICLFVLWLQRPKTGDKKHGKHHG